MEEVWLHIKHVKYNTLFMPFYYGLKIEEDPEIFQEKLKNPGINNYNGRAQWIKFVCV